MSKPHPRLIRRSPWRPVLLFALLTAILGSGLRFDSQGAQPAEAAVTRVDQILESGWVPVRDVYVTFKATLRGDGRETLELRVRYLHEVPRGPGVDVTGLETHRYRFELKPGSLAFDTTKRQAAIQTGSQMKRYGRLDLEFDAGTATGAESTPCHTARYRDGVLNGTFVLGTTIAGLNRIQLDELPARLTRDVLRTCPVPDYCALPLTWLGGSDDSGMSLNVFFDQFGVLYILESDDDRVATAPAVITHQFIGNGRLAWFRVRGPLSIATFEPDLPFLEGDVTYTRDGATHRGTDACGPYRESFGVTSGQGLEADFKYGPDRSLTTGEGDYFLFQQLKGDGGSAAAGFDPDDLAELAPGAFPSGTSPSALGSPPIRR